MTDEKVLWHENSKGQLVKCPAKIKCRLGGEHYEGADAAEAEKAREDKLMASNSSIGEPQKLVASSMKELEDSERSFTPPRGFKKGDPNVREKFSNAAAARDNEYLADRITRCEVVKPSTELQAEALQKAYYSDNEVAKESRRRKALERQLAILAKNRPDLEGSSYSFIHGDTKATVKFERGVSEHAWNKLTEEEQNACMAEGESYSYSAAKDILPPELLSQVSRTSEVANFVKLGTHDMKRLSDMATVNTEGRDNEAAVDAILQEYAAGEGHMGRAALKHVTAQKTEYTDRVKKEFERNGKPVLISSNYQEALVLSDMRTMDSKKIDELLTDEQKKAIKAPKLTRDAEKAKGALSKERYEEIFNAVIPKIRVGVAPKAK